MKIIVTGSAGFIASKVAFLLAKRGDEVIGIDNINTYYDPRLKLGRLAECGIYPPQGCVTTSCIPETGGDGTEVEYAEIPFGTPLRSNTLPI